MCSKWNAGWELPVPNQRPPWRRWRGLGIFCSVTPHPLNKKEKKKKGIKVDRDTKNINETHLKWHLVHLQVSQVSEMAHDSSLLLAPGSQKDLGKKKITNRNRLVCKQRPRFHCHPHAGSPSAFLHHPQQPGVLKSTDKTQLRWPVVKINFNRPVTANPVC